MNTLHPVMLQALRPFMPGQKTAQEVADDFAVQSWIDDHHQRNDAQALRLQMQAENSRTTFGETA